MKVAHSNKELIESGNWSVLARQHEEAEQYQAAAAAYEKAIRERPLDEKLYDRLLILYRKLKEPHKELTVLDKAIQAYETLYKRKDSYNKKIVQLSKALQKSTGLVDKKGKDLYEPEPLNRWKKRRKMTQKLAKKQGKGV